MKGSPRLSSFSEDRQPVVAIVGKRSRGLSGVAFRTACAGPEEKLVRSFLRRRPIKLRRGYRVTIFREPRLSSGFPDLVIVVWHEATARRWPNSRARLNTQDVRLMHYLTTEGPSTELDLRGIAPKGLAASLARLTTAQMIRRLGERWHARPLTRTFAAHHIIAVEVKVSEVAGGLDQAIQNTWFATASYLLMPHQPRPSQFVATAESLGVGVWTLSEAVIDARGVALDPLPRSYASWLFNEWAWRNASRRRRQPKKRTKDERRLDTIGIS